MVLNKDNSKTKIFNLERIEVCDQAYEPKQKNDNVSALSSAAAKSSANISSKRSDTIILEE
jgi:hypothetical protein